MTRKIILIIFFVLCLNQNNKAQSFGNSRKISSKEDLKWYEIEFGKTYLDSIYYFEGSLNKYQKDMDFYLDINLHIKGIFIYGNTKYNSDKIRYKNIVYKLHHSATFAYVQSVYLPLPFDLNANRNILKELLIEDCFIKGEDSVVLDFSNLDSLETLCIDCFHNKNNLYIKLKMPPNLKCFITDIPLSFITYLPKTLEELVIERDTIYPFFKNELPNLKTISFTANDSVSLPVEIKNMTSIKSIYINDSLTFKDIELLSTIPHVDTLALTYLYNNIFPENIYKLTNISVIKLAYGHIGRYIRSNERYKIAITLHKLLPNATIFYKVLKENDRQMSYEEYIKLNDY